MYLTIGARMKPKPNCELCKYGRKSGTYYKCINPIVFSYDGESTTHKAFSVFGVQAGTPQQWDRLGITADKKGAQMGCFNWPYKYEKQYLKSCKGFEVNLDGTC